MLREQQQQQPLPPPPDTVYSAYPPSPYLRRVSPPGSPAPKQCCYEHNKASTTTTTPNIIFCCCYTCPNDNTTSIFATLGICTLLLAYTILGGFIFMTIEGGSFEEHSVAASKTNLKGDNSVFSDLRAETVDRLWSITENLNILYRENWTRLAAEEVLIFQEALFKTLKNSGGGYYSSGTVVYYPQHIGHKWTFSSSFLYSLTLITTIGYGSVSPRTSWGKLVTIAYALIGIPLMLLYLSTTGDLLARSFRRIYGKLCGFSIKKTRHHQCQCTSTIRVPVTLCLIIILAYICSGAVLFHRLENWSILEGSYFCFTSLGTIGFGDLVPTDKDISLCACSAYILTGMALVAMCFSLVQDEVINILRYLGATCTKNKMKIKDEECS